MDSLVFLYMGSIFIGGLSTGFLVNKNLWKKRLAGAGDQASKIIDDAKKEALAKKKEILLQGKDEVFVMKKELEALLQYKEKELSIKDRKLQEQSERLEEKLEKLATKEDEVLYIKKKLTSRESELESLKDQMTLKIKEKDVYLQKISGLTMEEAKASLLKEVEAQSRYEAAKLMRDIESEARESADRKAKKIIATSIQRYAGEYVSEHAVTTVHLPNDEMKGRIIGREGRNIRALEAATGVDFIIDDTPETVALSAYSPFRRQIAKTALERLIEDGRIHPSRIEEVVRKCEEDLNIQVREIGEQATLDIGVHGVHPELLRLLGLLYYRTSYTQNVLRHSMEVGFLCGMMAAELGLDEKKAKRAGLFHDIGKAVDHEFEGSHARIGADLAKKYNEDPDIIHAIIGHHEEEKPETALAVLVQASDSLSGARPGARKELLESYVKRLEGLESIAVDFEGVSKAYVIQAGREVRVMVDADSVNDDQTYLLCKGISSKIEEQLTYPGQVRVTVVREHRAVGYAR